MTSPRAAALLFLITLASCGAPPRTVPARVAASPEPAATRDSAPPEGDAATVAAAPPASAINDSQEDQEEARPLPQDPPAPKQPVPGAKAELGRPAWWFTGFERTETRLRVCAEAGGTSVRDARRQAIRVARQMLSRELGREPQRDAVVYASVLPLPAADAGPGASRYIGYVLMEALTR